MNKSDHKRNKDSTPKIDKSIATLSALSARLLREYEKELHQSNPHGMPQKSMHSSSIGLNCQNLKTVNSSSVLVHQFRNNISTYPMKMDTIKNLRKGYIIPARLAKLAHSQSHKVLKPKKP
mmetsp:Transcript_35699/g.41335  ORF Transcript_35699/g.41335 Transcript_35699/m.41335 type:complete len:121 (+) Transcript_35699:40-402(+)